MNCQYGSEPYHEADADYETDNDADNHTHDATPRLEMSK